MISKSEHILGLPGVPWMGARHPWSPLSSVEPAFWKPADREGVGSQLGESLSTPYFRLKDTATSQSIYKAIKSECSWVRFFLKKKKLREDKFIYICCSKIFIKII